MICAVLVIAAGIWSYWPTLNSLVSTWNQVPDYSHGFLVAPVAAYFLWARRQTYPGIRPPAYIVGFSILTFTLLVRYLGARFYFGAFDAYSLLLWIASVVAICGGHRLLKWSLPSIAFLFFMIPFPFGLETAMSAPLQRIATKVSCWTLQLLGQPAFSEGNVILLGNQQLEVAQACSGLRLFASVIALAYAYVVLVRRPWWEKVVLLTAVAPIAILSNSIRIVATGFLFEFTTSDLAHRFSHDLAGWAMIPVAAAFFGLVLWYLRALIQEEEVLDISAVLRNVRN
jgi:exosortase